MSVKERPICECAEPVYIPSVSGFECGLCGLMIDEVEQNRRVDEKNKEPQEQ